MSLSPDTLDIFNANPSPEGQELLLEPETELLLTLMPVPRGKVRCVSPLTDENSRLPLGAASHLRVTSPLTVLALVGAEVVPLISPLVVFNWLAPPASLSDISPETV